MAVRVVTGRGARRTPAVLTDPVATAIPAPTVARAALRIGRVAMATPVRIVRVPRVGIPVRTVRAVRRVIVAPPVIVGPVPEHRGVSTALTDAPRVRRRISASVGPRFPRM